MNIQATYTDLHCYKAFGLWFAQSYTLASGDLSYRYFRDGKWQEWRIAKPITERK